LANTILGDEFQPALVFPPLAPEEDNNHTAPRTAGKSGLPVLRQALAIPPTITTVMFSVGNERGENSALPLVLHQLWFSTQH